MHVVLVNLSVRHPQEHIVPVRSASVALLATAALVLSPVGAALAAGSGDHPAGSKSAEAKARNQAKVEARQQARKLEARLNSHRSFVLGGTVADDAVGSDPAGTLTFIVHGHKYKVLRGSTVTVTVDPAAKITRGGSATLADLVTGDHVTVKSRAVDVVAKVTGAGADAVTSFTLTMTAHRVAASPADTETEASAG
jgi:hypothetical protein